MLQRVIAFLVAALAAQEEPKNPPADSPKPAAAQDAWGLALSGKYLAGLCAAERQVEAKPRDPAALDTLAVMRSFIGDGAGANEAMERMSRSDGSAAAPRDALDACERLDAVATIVELARSRRVVIVNEAHHVPQCRAFSMELARRLRPLGFTYLACETFDRNVAELTRRGHPTRGAGTYSVEPVFGDFIRRALALGYLPIAYEMDPSSPRPQDSFDQINERERQQCDHLVERLFAKDPEAKVLIHVGYSHATEDWRKLDDGRELAWMAARLARATGLDPLTIDQTEQRQASTLERSGALWRGAAEQGWLSRPTLFRRKEGSFVVAGAGWAGRVDLQVFLPPVKIVDGRPDWLALGGERAPVEIPVEIEVARGRALVQAFLASEPDEAVPVDQVVVAAGEPFPVLMLPEGEFRLVVQDEEGRELLRLPLDR